jgi:hypothetical protein
MNNESLATDFLAARAKTDSVIMNAIGRHYKAYQREQTLEDRLANAAAEKDASAARIGLWQDAVPVAPWEWRHPAKVEQ